MRISVRAFLVVLAFWSCAGAGVAQTMAERWRSLAEHGDPVAQSNLGFLYQTGDGLPQDFAEAMKWYRRAAAQGDGLAQSNIGFLYLRGHGIPQDYVRAHMWFNLAEASGERSVLGSTRDSLAIRMTPAQIAHAQEMAARCKNSRYRECD